MDELETLARRLFADSSAEDWRVVARRLALDGRSSEASIAFAHACARSNPDGLADVAREWVRHEARDKAVPEHELRARVMSAPASDDATATAALSELARATNTEDGNRALGARAASVNLTQVDPSIARVLRCQTVPPHSSRAVIPVTPMPRFLAEESDSIASALALASTFMDYVATTPRRRSKLEAPWELTKAYVSFEHAYLLSQFGLHARAQEAFQAAAASLPSRPPVHRVLTSVYEQRIVRPGSWRWTHLEAALAAAEADVPTLYSAIRLIDSSDCLDPLATMAASDPFNVFRSQATTGGPFQLRPTWLHGDAAPGGGLGPVHALSLNRAIERGAASVRELLTDVTHASWHIRALGTFTLVSELHGLSDLARGFRQSLSERLAARPAGQGPISSGVLALLMRLDEVGCVPPGEPLAQILDEMESSPPQPPPQPPADQADYVRYLGLRLRRMGADAPADVAQIWFAWANATDSFSATHTSYCLRVIAFVSAVFERLRALGFGDWAALLST